MYFTQAGQGRPPQQGDVSRDWAEVKRGAMQRPCSFLGKEFPGEMSPSSKALRQKFVWHVSPSAARGTKLRRSEHGVDRVLDHAGHLTTKLKENFLGDVLTQEF